MKRRGSGVFLDLRVDVLKVLRVIGYVLTIHTFFPFTLDIGPLLVNYSIISSILPYDFFGLVDFFPSYFPCPSFTLFHFCLSFY